MLFINVLTIACGWCGDGQSVATLWNDNNSNLKVSEFVTYSDFNKAEFHYNIH